MAYFSYTVKVKVKHEEVEVNGYCVIDGFLELSRGTRKTGIYIIHSQIDVYQVENIYKLQPNYVLQGVTWRSRSHRHICISRRKYFSLQSYPPHPL